MADDFWGNVGKGANLAGHIVAGGAQLALGDSAGAAKTIAAGYGGPKRGARTNMGGKKGARKPNAPAGDPWADLYNWADQFGSLSGGSGGSGGGGGGGDGGYGALMAAIQAQKDNATGRYNDQRGQIDSLYNQYANSLKPNEAATKAGWDTAITRANNAGNEIAAATTQRAAQNDAQRNAALTSLGVTGAAQQGSGDESKAVNEGNQQLAQQQQDWTGLSGALSNAQQARDRLDVQGATDAGVLAKTQLQTAYESYMRQLDQQAAGAVAGGSGGGSGGGGRGGSDPVYKNPMLDMINKAIGNDMIDQLLGKGNYKKSDKPSYSSKQIADAYKKVGALYDKNPSISTAQIKAKVGPGVWGAYNAK